METASIDVQETLMNYDHKIYSTGFTISADKLTDEGFERLDTIIKERNKNALKALLQPDNILHAYEIEVDFPNDN